MATAGLVWLAMTCVHGQGVSSCPVLLEKGTVYSGKTELYRWLFAVLWVASRPMLVLPETPKVKTHLGSRNAKDTTKEPGQAGQILTAPSELAARKPQVGSTGRR